MSRSLTTVKDGGSKNIYVDIDPIARQVVASKMMELTATFP
jgi:hypothetical protein